MKTVKDEVGSSANLRAALDARAAFRVGRANMTGTPIDPKYGVPVGSMGALPEPYASELFYGRPDFVVWSWQTPIAWHDSVNDNWRFPPVNYSVTTSNHQAAFRRAMNDPRDRLITTGPEVNLRKGLGTGVGAFGPGWQG